MISTIHKCPMCDNYVDIEAEYKEEDGVSETIILTATCSKCQVSRTTEVIVMGFDVEKMVLNLGI